MRRPVLEPVLQLVDLRHAQVASITRAIQSMAIQVLRADSKHTPLTLLARPTQRGKGRTILQAQLPERPQGQHFHPRRFAQVLQAGAAGEGATWQTHLRQFLFSQAWVLSDAPVPLIVLQAVFEL